MGYNSFYPWAKCDILHEFSIFTTSDQVKNFRHVQALSRYGIETHIVVIPCSYDELVCKNCQNEKPLCFFYETLFTKLGVRFPLSLFERGILNMMNVAPTQLHPNSWAFVHAFQILCIHFVIDPTSDMFFYFFEFRPSKRISWASLKGASGRGLLSLFQSSYKSFKGKFLKITRDFPDSDLLEGFPLYWSSHPKSQTSRALDTLEVMKLIAAKCSTNWVSYLKRPFF